MAFSWDSTYTIQSNESFFYEQRKNNRNIRTSTKINRVNKLKEPSRNSKPISDIEREKQLEQVDKNKKITYRIWNAVII